MSPLKLSQAIEGFLLHKQAEGRSPRTISDYRNSLSHFAQYLNGNDPLVADVGIEEHRSFFLYLESSPIVSGGVAPRPPKILSPKTRRNIYMCLSTFWNWCITENFIERHPLQTLKPSRAESPPIEPLSQDEIRHLLSACEMTRSWHNKPGTSTKRPTAERDKAIIWFMYDTGVRASELCKLKIGNIDLQNNRALVLGKGNKSRYVRIGRRCNKAIWRYLTTRENKSPDAPFIVVYHHDLERPMGRRALGRLLSRLGRRAGIQGQVHPHRLRHTFAIQFLRNSGDIYTLQALLGHTSLEMVKRYLRIAEADTVLAHRRASPGDHL